jgi:hypothetical protein
MFCFIRCFGFLLSSSFAPDNTLESEQRLFSTLRLTGLHQAIRNNRANLSDCLAEVFDGKTEPTGCRALVISPFQPTTPKIADYFPVYFRTQSAVKIKAIAQLEFSKSGPGAAVTAPCRSPVVAAAAGRGLGERQPRLFVPLWHARAPGFRPCS